MFTPSPLAAGILLVAVMALAGCIEGDGGCGEPKPKSLVVGMSFPGKGSQHVTLAFACETVDAEYTIDRYDFRLVLGRGGTLAIAPDPVDLSADERGSVTYYVPVDDNAPPAALRAPPENQQPVYEVRFTRWDPAHNEAHEPRIHITWDQDRDGERDVLPGGLYGVQLSLRSGTDTTSWFLTSIDY